MLNLLSAMLLLCIAVTANADMYRYTDDSGAVCMTNNIGAVPRKYRSSMTVIKEESPRQEKVLPEVKRQDRDPEQVAAEMVNNKAETPKPPPESDKQRYARTLLLFTGVVAVFYILRFLGEFVGAPRAGTALFSVVIIFAGVYLYRLYIDELGRIFRVLKTDAINIRQNVETREQKTDQLIKLQDLKEKQE